MWQLNVNVTFSSTSSSSSVPVNEGGGSPLQTEPADSWWKCRLHGLAATFICLARALTYLSVVNMLGRVMEEGGEEKKWANERITNIKLCVPVFACVCVHILLFIKWRFRIQASACQCLNPSMHFQELSLRFGLRNELHTHSQSSQLSSKTHLYTYMRKNNSHTHTWKHMSPAFFHPPHIHANSTEHRVLGFIRTPYA